MSRPLRVLVTGSSGQLGSELVRTAPPQIQITATVRDSLDITDRRLVAEAVRSLRPDLIINAAAYTAVDAAESEPSVAFRVNRDGVAHVAQAAAHVGARLIQISTDYVFDGCKTTPYTPEDVPNPLNVYGESKLAGERVALEQTDGKALIVRTSWLYARHGRNFVKTMLRSLRQGSEVKVVCDQIGSPTDAQGLARALWTLAEQANLQNVLHWTDAGVASWYDFAEAIRSAAIEQMANTHLGRVIPILTSERANPAQRPRFSVLDKTVSWSLLGIGPH
ncbi:MAG: dTDP-4-dehydrorhamnose reductase, partial [Terriglobales bacterium]